MTKQYRMLIVYNHTEKTLDQEKIHQHMEFAGFHQWDQNKMPKYTMYLIFLFHLVMQVTWFVNKIWILRWHFCKRFKIKTAHGKILRGLCYINIDRPSFSYNFLWLVEIHIRGSIPKLSSVRAIMSL